MKSENKNARTCLAAGFDWRRKSMNEEEKEFYWCNNRHDVIQIYTSVRNPSCPICGRVMTLGRYW